MMLNALIAIMSNSYEEIQRTVELEQLKAKWNMLGEMSYIVHNLKNFWKACVRSCRRRVHPMLKVPKPWEVKYHPRPKYLVVNLPKSEEVEPPPPRAAPEPKRC